MGKVGHASWGEVRLGDGEVLGRSVELSGAGRSLEVNEEAGEQSPCPMWVGGGGGVVWMGKSTRKRFPQTNSCHTRCTGINKICILGFLLP